MLDDADELRDAHEVELEEIADRLQCFIYLLIRDRVPMTDVTEVVKVVEDSPGNKFVFTSAGLANIGREMAHRLMGFAPVNVAHEWVLHPTEAGASTIIEHCWLCGTLRLSTGDLPQDGYEYFEPGARPAKHLGQPRGADAAPFCIQRYERIHP